MSIISLIKLIIIGAGMFYYYRLMDENNGYYISIPITAGAIFLRTGRYTKRALGAMFEPEAKNEDGSARSSVFLPALYFAAGITIK